jgi:hypothetical protein
LPIKWPKQRQPLALLHKQHSLALTATHCQTSTTHASVESLWWRASATKHSQRAVCKQHRPLSRVLFRVCRSRCDDACFLYRTPHATAGRHGCHCCHRCKHCRQNVLAHVVWHRVYREHECDRRCAKHRCRRLRGNVRGTLRVPSVLVRVYTVLLQRVDGRSDATRRCRVRGVRFCRW